MLGIGLLTLPLANRFAVNLGDTLGNMMAGAVAYARNTTSPQMPRVDLMNDNIFGDALRSAAKEAGVALISPSQLTVASVIFSFDKSGSQIAETTQIPPGSVLIGGPLLHRTAIDLIPKLPRDVKLVAFDLRNPVLEDLANLPVSLKGRAGPEPYAYYGYAAVQILAAALAKAGSSGDAVADALRKDTYETAVGRVTFQASDGERLQPSLALYVTSTGGALSFCPSCSTNTDDCKDKGCPCQDKSCSKDCCPGH